MRKCSTCGHVFFAHGPDGCRTCGCTGTRGGLFRPDTPPEKILRTLRPPQALPEQGRGSSTDGSQEPGTAAGSTRMSGR